MTIDLRNHPYATNVNKTLSLQKQLLASFGTSSSEMMFVEVSGANDCADLFRCLEQQTFDAAFGSKVPHTPDLMLNEYGPYDEKSTFFGVINPATGEALGTLRVIVGYPNKTTIDLERSNLLNGADLDTQYQLQNSAVWDIGSVAVGQQFRGTVRGSRIAQALYHQLYAAAHREQVDQWTSVIDSQVLRRYHRLGIPFTRLAAIEDLNYLGSSARACHLWVDQIRPSMEAQAQSESGRIRTTILAILNGTEAVPQAEVRDIDLRDRTVARNIGLEIDQRRS